MKPMTSEEQKAALGNVRRKPTQIDLLTGDLVVAMPRRGRGDHISLKSTGREKTAVPGMASYSGEGPEGKRCEDCRWFGRVKIIRPDMDTVETSIDACLRAAQLTGRSPMPRQQIRHCNACRMFTQHEGERREWRIAADGVTREIVDTSPQGDKLGQEVGRR